MVSFLNIINGYPVSVLPSVWLAPWRRRGHQGERGDQGERVLVGGWIWLGGSREGIFRTTQSMLELECHPRWDLGDHHECREDLLFLLPHPLFLPPHLPLCLLLVTTSRGEAEAAGLDVDGEDLQAVMANPAGLLRQHLRAPEVGKRRSPVRTGDGRVPFSVKMQMRRPVSQEST